MSRVDETREPWLRAVDPDEEGPSWIESYRKHILVTAALVLVAFGGAIWYAYQAGGGAMGDAPLVAAPDGTYRHKPEDPGGLTVPDRDKLVYNRVNGAPGAEDVHLRPGPELPMDKPEPAATEDIGGGVGDGEPALIDPLGEGAPSAAVVEDHTPVPPPATPAPASVPAPSVAVPVPPAPVKEPAKIAAKPAAGGHYMLQLGAFGTQAAADGAWAAAQKKFPAALGGLSRDIDQLSRDGKTLYRLRGSSFADKAAADAACAQLKAGSHACFVAAK
ncbi:SPOR domain-containing protein [Govanella unica]|uniref:SPOR domain-containing protein n=1 Tax=Govanella unica TaxID=2975056 RepID=A0A9X3TX53_9PROT|nr:SPOR domain-containing protein [Govania unica]MDA5193315.1 SPOR domain-containing protein [Govania unica]